MSIVGLCGRTVVRNAVQPDTPPITIIYTYNWRKTDFDRLRPWIFPSSYKKKKKKETEIRRKEMNFSFFFFFRYTKISEKMSLFIVDVSFFLFFFL